MSLSHAVKTSHRLRSTKATTTMSSGSLHLCSHARTLKIRLNLNSHSSLSRLGNSSRSNHSRGGTSRTGDSNRTLSNHSSHRTGDSNRTLSNHSSHRTGISNRTHSSKTGATLSNHSRDTTTHLNSSSKSCLIRFLKRLLRHGRFCREAYFEAV